MAKCPTEPVFWLVWCDGGGPPTVKHREYLDARSEARRLAQANPGHRFVVLAAAAAFEVHAIQETHFHPPAVDVLDQEIPF